MYKDKDKKCVADNTKIVIYGGNGFVGTHIAERFTTKKICTVCLSRSGHKPVHLKDERWSEMVRWCKGDASQPDLDLLSTADVLVTLVGSPPIPTFSSDAYEQQVFMNGTCNVNAIEAAAKAGIKHLVVMGAKLPRPLQGDWFGYAKGKRMSLDAAKKFSELSEQHSAVVLQPAAIYGTRYLKSGKSLALGRVLKPLSHVMPWQFISVDRVAERTVDAALSREDTTESFVIIPHEKI